MNKIKDRSLYLVLSEEYGKTRKAPDIAKLAASGGIDILQMREKNKTRRELVELGRELSYICKTRNVKFIVNDDPELAKEVSADGVHLGQEDLKIWSAARARDLLGPDKIIGISTHSLEQFKKADEGDADYIAFGPIFPTKTKDYSIGTGDVEEVLDIAERPVVFIGGINLMNIDDILRRGAKNIALIRAVLEADDIASAAASFKAKLKNRKKRVKIKINGKEEMIDKKQDIAELVAGKRLSPACIVVEHNLRIVPKEEWHRTALNDNDTVEIISFVGGG